MVKQIGIAIIATVILIVVGFGSYMISTKVIPDPTTTKTTNNNNATTTMTDTVTVQVVDKLTPTNLVMKKEGNDVVIQFDTAEKTGAVVYVTPDKSQVIAQVVKDWGNGVRIKGTFYSVTPDDSPSTAHSIKLLGAASTLKSDQTYFYIILSYKKAKIPYGGVQDAKTGPSAPYTLKF